MAIDNAVWLRGFMALIPRLYIMENTWLSTLSVDDSCSCSLSTGCLQSKKRYSCVFYYSSDGRNSVQRICFFRGMRGVICGSGCSKNVTCAHATYEMKIQLIYTVFLRHVYNKQSSN